MDDCAAMAREKKRAARAIGLHLISEFDFEKAEDDFARATLAYEQSKQNNRLEKESIEFELSAAGFSGSLVTTLVLFREVDSGGRPDASLLLASFSPVA